MSVQWPTRHTHYSDMQVGDAGHDGFLWLMRQLRDLLDSSGDKKTAHQLYGTQPADTPNNPPPNRYRRQQQATEVRAAETVTQDVGSHEAGSQVTPRQREACLCGRTTHHRNDCQFTHEWKMSQGDYDRFMKYVSDPSSRGFDERIANALRPMRNDRGGQQGG